MERDVGCGTPSNLLLSLIFRCLCRKHRMRPTNSWRQADVDDVAFPTSKGHLQCAGSHQDPESRSASITGRCWAKQGVLLPPAILVTRQKTKHLLYISGLSFTLRRDCSDG